MAEPTRRAASRGATAAIALALGMLAACASNDCVAKLELTAYNAKGSLLLARTLHTFYGTDARPCTCSGGRTAEGRCEGWTCSPPESIETEPGSYDLGLRARDDAGRRYLGAIPIVISGSDDCFYVGFAQRKVWLVEVGDVKDPANCRLSQDKREMCGW